MNDHVQIHTGRLPLWHGRAGSSSCSAAKAEGARCDAWSGRLWRARSCCGALTAHVHVTCEELASCVAEQAAAQLEIFQSRTKTEFLFKILIDRNDLRAYRLDAVKRGL